MQSAGTSRWEQLVKREARSIDGASLGEIKQIGPAWVIPEKVSENEMTRFYLPKCLAKGFDGKVVAFEMTEADAEKNFMKPVTPGPGEYEICMTNETPLGLETSVPST
jgi:hypothetical protein